MILSAELPEDPATLTLTVFRPDWKVDIYRIGQLDRDGLIFSKDYQPEVEGQHRWTFDGTRPMFYSDGYFTAKHHDLPQPKTTVRPAHGVTVR